MSESRSRTGPHEAAALRYPSPDAGVEEAATATGALPQGDLFEVVQRSTRRDFIALHEVPLLICESALQVPEGPSKTHHSPSWQRASEHRPADPPAKPAGEGARILAVRKVHQTFPSMITIGRTVNNDIVVRDIAVSKFHAFFRMSPGRLELSDAGSRNGTWIGTRRLEPKAPAQPVARGDRIRIGPVEFVLLDAASCWDRIHHDPDF